MKNCFWMLSPAAVQEKVPPSFCVLLSRALFFLTVDKTLNYLSVHLSDLFWPEKFCSPALCLVSEEVLSYYGVGGGCTWKKEDFCVSPKGGGGFEKGGCS